jgi:hypothetical protein
MDKQNFKFIETPHNEPKWNTNNQSIYNFNDVDYNNTINYFYYSKKKSDEITNYAKIIIRHQYTNEIIRRFH